jgi:heavy metal translocating P-type ATPase
MNSTPAPTGASPVPPPTAPVCDLCALPLPRHPHDAEWRGHTYRFCCTGCRQVFLILAESGTLEGDFRSSDLYRTSLTLGIIGKPDTDEGAEIADDRLPEDGQELVLHVDGMWCSSCSWLIEKVIGAEPGVVRAKVLYASDTAKIVFRPAQISVDEIRRRIGGLGYAATERDADPAERSSERRSLLVRMGVALFLMNNLMFFSYTLYVGYFQDLPPAITAMFPWILFGFALPAVFWCGMPIHRKAFRSLRAGVPTMELLFSIGIFSAFFFSVYQLLTGGDNYYFDTCGGLVALLLVGKLIEVTAKHRASEGVHRLYTMMPKKVRVKAPEGERMISAARLQPGEIFIVKSGEKIPADGTVVEGGGVVDESLLTGESRLVKKGEGAKVLASSMNVNGIMEIRVDACGRDTILSSIIRMVEGALASKSDLERMVDRVSRVFIPGVLAVATVTAVVMFALGSGAEASILRAITVLLIACPCVLGMATPLAVAAGIGHAASRGILVRDGMVLEVLGSATAVVFDKTGTLTAGNFECEEIVGSSQESDGLLRAAASLEQSSSHPVALALVRAARKHRLLLTDASDVSILDGQGIRGVVDGSAVILGSRSLLQSCGIHPAAETEAAAIRAAASGKTVVYGAVGGGREAAVFILGDSLKPSARPAVEKLEALGLEVQLLSGDMPTTTAAIAGQAGIRDFLAGALPAGKIEMIKHLQQTGKRVVMVGDGVNDAPALAQADAGIAMGGGTEMAIQSAPVTLLRDDLTLIPEAVEIARRGTRIMKQNLVWAFLYNTVGIVLAASGLMNPLLAAGAMVASSLSVVLNSMRVNHPRGAFSRRIVDILFPWIERETSPGAEQAR